MDERNETESSRAATAGAPAVAVAPRHPVPGRTGTRRLFVTYGAICLVPVLILGAVLGLSYRSEAAARGAAQGRSEATLVAQTAVEPLLGNRPLADGLSTDQTNDLRRLVTPAVDSREVLRLRLRTLAGRIVFADDGSGSHHEPDDEALEAARGETVVRLTHLNADDDDQAAQGPASVEVYLPLEAGTPARRVGVLEIYLPYAPIDADVTAGLHTLYRDLALGLGALYLAIFVISASVSRRLRRQLHVNAYLAEHDHLTALPNRAWFLRQARSAVEGRGRGGSTALAIIDLDRFKEVNDTLGHHNGDRLLSVLAERITAQLGPESSVARMGGDEFGVIIRGSPDPETVLWQLRSVIEGEIEVSALPVSVDSSVGYVLVPQDGEDVDQLLQRADVAMYVAKAEHAGVVRYQPSQNHYNPADLTLVSELRHAIDDGQLVVHFQPKATLANGHIESVEALVRWQHPQHGLVFPDRFMPLAEQTDLIHKLTAWVLDRALADLRRLDGAAFANVAVAVNVSARNLAQRDFSAQVVDALSAAQVAPERLVIEITETALLADPARAALVLGDLHRAGVRVSLDDFGCGYTSLGYLSTLPVHELKIDRSFVTDMAQNPAHRAIVRAIVDLGHNLSLRVVAEGVETSEALALLRAVGCDVVQGYVLAPAMPLAELEAWLLAPAPPVGASVGGP